MSTTPIGAPVADLAAVRDWWASDGPANSRPYVPAGEGGYFRIADVEADQPLPDGVDNPYWQIVRELPCVNDYLTGDGITPCMFAPGLETVGRTALTVRYAWSIPTPGDLAWMRDLLDGTGLVETGAGSGYWAWQAAQYGIDVVAYEPADLADNRFASVEYAPLLRDGAGAAARHPDRALFLCWPSYGDPWAAHALASYRGDLVIYAGEGEGGCCADDAFFELLDAEWVEADAVPRNVHITWWGIHDRITAYHRKCR